MINTEINGTLDQDSRTTYVGSHPINAVPEVDILERLQNNIDQLDELCAQMSFVMREVRSIMKL
jgi:hypothetical protein